MHAVSAKEMVMSCKVTRPITAGVYNQFTVLISAWRVLVWQRETSADSGYCKMMPIPNIS